MSLRMLIIRTALLFLVVGTPVLISTFHPANAAERVTTYDTFNTDERVVALTFDVTFDRGDGPEVLDTLQRHGVRATFAITGIWAQRNPDLIRRIVNEGHGLMNHTWDHFSLTGEYTNSRTIEPTDRVPREEVISQLQRTESLVRQQVGVDMKPYVRPPYGDYDDEILEAMADAGYTHNIMWTVDTFGWYRDPVHEVRQRALDAAQPGANILMHIGHGSTDGEALEGIITGYREMGYEFATVQDFIEGGIAQPESIWFPETSQALGGSFLRYWNNFGGLETFGYPISPELVEDGVTVQYFERARFEYRPGTWPERWDVHLTRIGAEYTRHRRQEEPFKRLRGQSDDYCAYFEQTEHTLCGGFRAYWEERGGVAIFGYPISQEFEEVNPDTGETYVVQYFERQRFEWHPGEWPERHDVFLGRLGAEMYAQRHQD